MAEHKVILLTVDSLRADALSIMPDLSALRKEGAHISKVYANGPSTPFSFPSLFNMNYHPFFDKPKIISPTIVELYRERGYRTAGVVANNPYISSLSGYQKGFSFFEDYMSSLRAKRRVSASSMIDKAPKFLRDLKDVYKWYFKEDITSAWGSGVAIEDATRVLTRNEPVFLWLHLMDTHYPYTPPLENTKFNYSDIVRLNKFRKEHRLHDLGDEKTLKDLRQLYNDCVRWTDIQIRSLCEMLKNQNLWDTTDLIITADHGEGFYEHGFLGHPAQLYEELVRVPLVVKVKSKNEASLPIRQLRDVPELLLSIMKPGSNTFEKEANQDDSIPLRACHAGNRSCMKGDVNLIGHPDKLDYNIYGFVKDDYKLIYDEETKNLEFYNLKEDPGERNDISNENKTTIKNLIDESYPFP